MKKRKQRTLTDFFSFGNNHGKAEQSLPPCQQKGKEKEKQDEECENNVYDHDNDNDTHHDNENTIPLPSNNMINKPINNSPISSSSRKRQQLFLDFGQKHLSHYTCKSCGMTFQKGVREDEQMHEKYHSKHSADSIITYKLPISSISASGRPLDLVNGFIHKVNFSSCSEAERKRAKQVLRVINERMNASQDDSSNISQIWLYLVNGSKVMGLLAAEAVDGTEMEIIGDGNIVAGVNRIWVHPSQRRKGIASKLLDQMRGGFVFGCCLAKSQIAFSQPTDAGKILACKYLSTPHPPIYHRRRE